MADITKNIIFKISTAYAPGMLMDLKAGYDMLSSMYNVTRKYLDSAEELLDVQDRLQIDISKVNATVRGLAGSMNLVQNANKLSMAGYKVTAQQFADLSKYAALWADATGKKTPEALDQLVAALIHGRESGLRPFGLSVDETKDKGARFNDTLQQMGEKAEGASNKLDTLREKQESWGDAALVYGAGVVAGFKSMHSEAESMNKYFTEGAVFRGENDENIGLLGWLKKTIYEMDNARLAAAEMDKQMLAIDEGRWISTDIPEQQFSWAGSEKGDWFKDTMSLGKTVNVTPGVYTPPATEGKRGGGGGARKQLPDLLGGGISAFEQEMIAMDGFMKEMLADNTAELTTAERMILDDTRVSYQEHLEEMKRLRVEAYQNEIDTKIEQMEFEREMLTAYKLSEFEIMLGAEQQYVNESARLWQSGLQGKMMMMGGFFNALSQLMTVKNKAMFEIGKVGAIAEAGVNTYLGAIKAYQAMAGIPYVGPFLGAIAAAAITAAGIANIAKIRSMSYGGGGGVESRGGGADVSGISGGNAPSMGGGGSAPSYIPSQEPQQINITIKMGDDALFLDAMIDINDKAMRTGRRYFKAA